MHLVRTKTIEHFANMAVMLFDTFREHENVVHENENNPLRTEFMSRVNCAVALAKPNSVTMNSNTPNVVKIVVFGMSLGFMRIWWNPSARSILLTTL